MNNNLNIKNISYAILIAAAMTSCVTRKKYDDLSTAKVKLEAERSECVTNLEKANQDLARLNKEIKALNETNSKLANDTAETGLAYRKTRTLYNELNDTYEKLLKNHNRLLSTSAAEADKLSKDLTTREKELALIEQNLQESKTQNEKLNEDLKTREQRVKELEKVLAEKEKAVNALRSKVSNALLSFKEKDLTVNIKNGKVYVSLSEQLLFKSGSYAVDKAGIEAIKKLAPVLKDQADIAVTVEGHTDDVPFSKGGTSCIADNWDLSVLRATSIVRLLATEGVDGAKLAAAGRGQHLPLEQGKTPEIRAKNRRTEIILTPKLDELFQLLDNQ